MSFSFFKPISSNHAHVKWLLCLKSIFRVLIGFSHGRNQLCRLWEMFHYKKWKKVIRYCIQVNQPADSISCLNTHDRKNKIDFQYIRTTYESINMTVWCLHVNMVKCFLARTKVRSSYGSLAYFPIFSFLAKMLSFLLRDDNIFARNENVGKYIQADHNLNGL